MPTAMNTAPTATATTTTTTMSENQPQPTSPFTPGKCLFCPKACSTFAASVSHMQTSHGLFVPRQGLMVDLETMFQYLHLVIFGYRECLQCGTERSTVQAVQQHMTGKGHCRFDTSGTDSEFADFYDLPVAALGLPSGSIMPRQCAAASEGPTRRRGRCGTWRAPSAAPASLSKRERRDLALATRQLANMRAGDRSCLMHMPTSQQRATLLAQNRQAERTQRADRRKQGHVDAKGNKNLYAYWATETPVYQCG